MAAPSQLALVLEWSPSRVRIFDPVTLQSTYANSLAEVSTGGREVIIGVRRTSVLIRTVTVPNAPRADVRRILDIQLAKLLPFAPGEFVYDFRVGDQLTNRGKTAIVGALKTELLNRVYDEAAAANIRVRAVVPIAFGSWLAARAANARDGAVVDLNDGSLNIDIIRDGELWYSRTVPLPPDPDGVDDEIARTFIIADSPPGPVIAAPGSGVTASITLPREPIAFLADSAAVTRQLFSFELPSRVEARRQRAEQWQATRAIIAATVAVALVGYLGVTHTAAQASVDQELSGVNRKLRAADKKVQIALAAQSDAAKAQQTLELALRPAQSLSDVIAVIANSAPKDSWLTSISVGRDRPMILIGSAVADENVGQFVAALTQSPRFQAVKTISINRGLIGKQPVTEFNIGGRARALFGFERRNRLALNAGGPR
jgi:Tfp pilus assembly protein PilN